MSAQPGPSRSGTVQAVAAPPSVVRDGWIGTKDLPGYRAGQVVVKLDSLPGVDAEHLYLDVLLLDASGHTQDNHSGPCSALGHRHTLDDRSHFVRIVAELLRHALEDAPSIASLGQALSFLREHGVDRPRLIAAAQLLDAACDERAVVLSLRSALVLSLGEEDGCLVLRTLLERGGASVPPDAELDDLLPQLVRQVGKARARRLLREATDFALVPDAELLGLL